MCKCHCDMFIWSPLSDTQEWYRCMYHSLSYHIHGHSLNAMKSEHQFIETLWFHSHWPKSRKMLDLLQEADGKDKVKSKNKYHILIIYSSVDGHRLWSHFLAGVNGATRNVEMWVSQWHDDLESFGDTIVLFSHEECNHGFRKIDTGRDRWVRRKTDVESIFMYL